MRILARSLASALLALGIPSLALVGCTDKPAPEDTAPPEETATPDTGDTAPPVETGDTAPPVETGETGDSGEPIIDNDGDGSPVEEDCDDADALVYPGAVDAICDGVDADCDGVGTDEAFLIGEARYADLATAIAAAVDGDTVDVCPGIWVGNVTLDAPIALTLRGASGSNADTELDGGSVGPALRVGSGVDLTLEDVAVVNGVALWIDDDLETSGGGLFADDARVTLRRARFTNNTAQDDGAGVAIRITDPALGALVVEDSEFTDNRASANGGGIAVLATGEAEVSITGSVFTTNRAPTLGAGVYLEGGELTATVTSCTFTTNDASGARSYGAGIAGAGDEVSLSVYDTTFSGNTAGNSAGGLSMTADRSELYVEGSTFSANTATQAGGAMRVTSDDFHVEVVDTNLASNLSNTQGGAVELDGGGYATFDTVTATDNSAGNAGGAYYLDEGEGLYMEVALTNGTLTTNRAGIGGGGGVYVLGARLQAVTVEFGSGVDTNTPEDVYRCSTNFGSSASFVFDESAGYFCQ